MAYTLSRNLRLRIDSNLTSNSKYNLERLDSLGSTFLVDSTETLNVRSKTDILIEPESADLGGSASGGTVSIGTLSHSISTLTVYSGVVNLRAPIGFLDQASSGTKYLRFRYKSDILGSVDTVADRVLSVDMSGADRDLTLGGNLSTTGGNLSLTLTANSSLTLPTTGTLATLAGLETLTNKNVDATSNTLTNIANASIAAGAGIVYSKLNLSASILGSDISPSAAIPYSKLTLTGSLVDADVSTSAALSRAKVAAGTASHVLINSVAGLLSSEAQLSKSRGGTGQDNSSLTFPGSGQIPVLPAAAPTVGYVLTAADTAGTLSWSPVGTGTVTSVALNLPTSLFDISGSPVTTAGTLTATLDTQVANRVFAGPTGGAATTPTFRALVLADLPAITTTDVSEGANLYFTDERAQDAIGAALTDSASIDFNYTDIGGTITAAVLPAGVDHDSLQNFVANKHIDHSSVAIDTAVTSGLSGGGTITTTRNLIVSPTSATAATPASADVVLFADASNSDALRKATLGEVLEAYKVVATWAPGDGTVKTVTHNLGSSDVTVDIYDIDTGENLWVDTVDRTSNNAVELTSSTAPTGSGLRVIIRR